MASRRKRMQLVTVGLVAAVVATVFLTASAGAKPTKAQAYPRSQTLITSGTQWGNISGTNPYVGNYAAGMVGLVNETLLRFDPVKGKYINWLAKSAKFTGLTQYTCLLYTSPSPRDGL